DAVVDVILRACRSRWPEGIFQDAESDVLHSLRDPWVWQMGTRSREFFVYKDRHVAETWDDTGTTAENVNQFLHFLVGQSTNTTSDSMQLTVVHDEFDDWMRKLIDELRPA